MVGKFVKETQLPEFQMFQHEIKILTYPGAINSLIDRDKSKKQRNRSKITETKICAEFLNKAASELPHNETQN